MQDLLDRLDFLSDLHAVGGCVRDGIIGRDSDDVDLATSDRPEKILDKCHDRNLKTAEVGLDHGTVLVVLEDGTEVEVTTFREDLLCDGRHAEVRFTDDIEEDLKRRDFTINAMAMDSEENLRDPFGGREDIERGVIRTVRQPLDRFHEDLLRVIRGIRFAARYDFEIEDQTWEAMQKVSDEVLDNVSVERVVMELEKAFKDPRPSRFLEGMYELGLLQELIPPFEGMADLQQNPEHHPEGDVFSHICNVVDRAPANPDDRFVALFHDLGKAEAAEPVEGEDYCTFIGHEKDGAELVDPLCDRLKLSNDRRKMLRRCTKLHMKPLHVEQGGSPKKSTIRQFQDDAGEYLDCLQTLCEADHDRGDSELFRELEDPIEPVLSGQDLIDRGHEPGPHFGEALDAAKEHQLNTGCTDKECLYSVAEPYLN